MRALTYVIAVVFVLAGPSFTGARDQGGDPQIFKPIPGIGTFAYNGSPVIGSASRVMASLGH